MTDSSTEKPEGAQNWATEAEKIGAYNSANSMMRAACPGRPKDWIEDRAVELYERWLYEAQPGNVSPKAWLRFVIADASLKSAKLVPVGDVTKDEAGDGDTPDQELENKQHGEELENLTPEQKLQVQTLAKLREELDESGIMLARSALVEALDDRQSRFEKRAKDAAKALLKAIDEIEELRREWLFGDEDLRGGPVANYITSRVVTALHHSDIHELRRIGETQIRSLAVDETGLEKVRQRFTRLYTRDLRLAEWMRQNPGTVVPFNPLLPAAQWEHALPEIEVTPRQLAVAYMLAGARTEDNRPGLPVEWATWETTTNETPSTVIDSMIKGFAGKSGAQARARKATK